MIKGLTSPINFNNLKFSENSFLNKKDPSGIDCFLIILLNLIDQSLSGLFSEKETLDFQFSPYFIRNLQLNNLFTNREMEQNVDDNFENISRNLSIENISNIFKKIKEIFKDSEKIANLEFLNLNDKKENILIERKDEKDFSFDLDNKINNNLNLNKNIDQKSNNVEFLEYDKTQNLEKYFSYSNVNKMNLNFYENLDTIQRSQHEISQYLIKKNYLIQRFIENLRFNKDIIKNVFPQNFNELYLLKTIIKKFNEYEFNKEKISNISDGILCKRVIEKGNNNFLNSPLLESEKQNKGFDLIFHINKKSLEKFDNFQRLGNQDSINSFLNLNNNFEIQSQLNVEKININFQNFREEIVEFFKNIFLELQPEGVNRALIKLNSPEMGILELEIKVKNKEVEIVAKIEKPEVFQEIRQNVNNIKIVLENSGMVLKDFQMFLFPNFYNGKMSNDEFEKENRKNNENRYRIESIKNTSDNIALQNNQVEKIYNKNGRYYYIV